MKKGDIVTIKDGSFTRSVGHGKLIREFLNFGFEKGKKYVIVETGCSFPNTGSRDFPDYPATFNNTVIQAIGSGKVVFVEERFLELVPPKHKIMIDMVYHHGCMLCGNTVEISDKLYQAIKNDPQTRRQ